MSSASKVSKASINLHDSNGSTDSKEHASKSRSKQKIDRKHLNDSDDISIDKLEILANKDKLKNDHDDHSARSRQSKHSSSHSRHQSRRKLKNREGNDNKETREDNNTVIKEKISLLFKLAKIYAKNGQSSNYTMDNTLKEIRLEYDRLNSEIQTDQGIKMYKKMLMGGVQMMEWANNTFDPIGLELNGWSESMEYQLEGEDYESVLHELYDKYKDTLAVMPELKLAFMVGLSGALFHGSMKIKKSNPEDAISKMFNNMMNKSSKKSFIPEQNESDDLPSKLNDPESLNIEHIFKQMEEQKLKQQQHQQHQQVNVVAPIDVVVPVAKKRGRPRKNAV